MKYNTQKQVEKIVSYFQSGETGRDKFKLGVEIENFLIDKKNLKTVSYYGKNGVEETMRSLMETGEYQGKEESGHLLELHKKDYNFTTEPGGQLELSLAPRESIGEIEREYLETMGKLNTIISRKNQWIVNMAYHPTTKIEQIKLLPKERYAFMEAYFKTTGRFAHYMMKGTCSLQVSIDYADQEDFAKKYHLLSAMSPIFYTLFDNGPQFEGTPYLRHNLRQSIWEETDKQRCGLLPTAFEEDFGYEAYAKWLLKISPIFMEQKDELVAEQRSFKEVFDPDSMGEKEIFHMLSIVFPDIRVKQYLEIRMMDSLPYPLNIAAVALIKGIFLNRDNVDFLNRQFKKVTFEQVQRIKEEATKKGLKTVYLEKTIGDWGKELFEIAHHSLSEQECKFLQPLQELVKKHQTLKMLFEQTFAKEGFYKAVEKNALSL